MFFCIYLIKLKIFNSLKNEMYTYLWTEGVGGSFFCQDESVFWHWLYAEHLQLLAVFHRSTFVAQRSDDDDDEHDGILTPWS